VTSYCIEDLLACGILQKFLTWIVVLANINYNGKVIIGFVEECMDFGTELLRKAYNLLPTVETRKQKTKRTPLSDIPCWTLVSFTLLSSACIARLYLLHRENKD
jgi:hypothetical protein